MTADIDARKREIRERVRVQRRQVTEEQSNVEAHGLTEQLQRLVEAREARSVSCYFPVVGEPNTLLFLEWARAHDVDVMLPISREDGLLDWVAYSGPDAEPGLFGIPEPQGTPLSPMAVNDVDLMIIPACAVDESGNRLGWGRGYFDKSLGSMDQRPPVFAVVRENEIFAEVPADLHDVPITGAVTPEAIHHFRFED
ncbi:5-formyltetrahydrofolate cyclo-ligase [Leucobacter sp. UCMA 4100]|uniref:5-formyltetrahydrofolate cyclo-ligase n=1 Tax=Leucobacter sp. UCMA 4100 TaxID=2810534 RepID=UPI0022EA572A|nr:5-formyltetrahydrofolate cyclo-ligase [Leucobacter sp. UCMA 4100]MDA3147513.1 5-formyltetrahydrofolate cyclo-ligase [Leucobacter sp. UCMA 4100]